MCIDIEGILRHFKRKKMTGLMSDDNGIPMTDKEIRSELAKALSEGKEVLPMGDCDNFDFKTGCRGHDVVLLVHDYEFEEGNG